jgi:hypothetical protein
MSKSKNTATSTPGTLPVAKADARKVIGQFDKTTTALQFIVSICRLANADELDSNALAYDHQFLTSTTNAAALRWMIHSLLNEVDSLGYLLIDLPNDQFTQLRQIRSDVLFVRGQLDLFLSWIAACFVSNKELGIADVGAYEFVLQKTLDILDTTRGMFTRQCFPDFH